MSWWFKIDLWKRVMLGLVLGLGTGLGLRYGMGAEAGGAFAEGWIEWAGDLFLRLIRMLIVPLIFFTLVSGIIAMGDPKRLGSLGVRTLATYFGTTAIAVTLGLIMATIFRPGASLSPETFAGADTSRMQSVAERASEAGGIVERLLNIVPTNPVEALATGNILQIIFFAIMFGVGLLMAGKIAEPVARWFDGASDAMMKVTIIVMETAPIGVFALMATVMAKQGLGVLQSLGTLAIALYLACALHILITYGGIIIKGILRLPFIPFLRGITDAQAVAYSTASSSATLPVTITCAEENLGIDKAVAGSVLPLGATINMDGTAIYIGMVALFGAQAMGIEVSLGQYFLIALMATLVSIGAAGIPSAGLFLSGLALAQVGIPEEQAFLIIGFILPFDRLLDMMRTLTNVTGDAAVATAVAKWEGELDEDVFRAEDNLSAHVDDREKPLPT
ncbi:MAG: dicarboxylate/amino acid:cation symporter [Hyphomonas sp.]|jgi:Na+/H+-dicarboxylate symporter|nr:dicarboxylate/amino acid:cation symporter [Henriciella sp.]MBO6695226.1 dicarboxylate/amino acid:cation symporter [Henriciella sp.]MCH9751224.1 dicarboxylate/amino acid:cation symporter [Alphaproteobacteria bacterium]MCR9224584.1 dicarboxylate/amino acid:cation symporter [Hyphomonas sp.]